MNFMCQLGEKWHTDIRIWINANESGKTMTTPANRVADKTDKISYNLWYV